MAQFQTHRHLSIADEPLVSIIILMRHDTFSMCKDYIDKKCAVIDEGGKCVLGDREFSSLHV
jgi:hypothetical protein